MKRHVVLYFILPLLSCGQQVDFPVKTDLEKIYTQAIGDFIKAGNERNKNNFDTLYFGKRAYGQPDDFPDIELPELIEHTHIKLISPEAGKTMQLELKSRIYINLIGWVNPEKAEFEFVIFSNGLQHQYDCSINYIYNRGRKEFELNKLLFSDVKKSN